MGAVVELLHLQKPRFTAIITVAKIFNMIFGALQNSGPWASALLAIWLIRPCWRVLIDDQHATTVATEDCAKVRYYEAYSF